MGSWNASTGQGHLSREGHAGVAQGATSSARAPPAPPNHHRNPWILSAPGSHQEHLSSSSTSKPWGKSMDLTSSRDPPGAPEILQHLQTTGEIHGFYQFPFSSAIPSKHSPKFHLSEAHSMEFSPIWLHDHKTQHDNLIISIASIKFCSFQKFKSSVVTHQAWKSLNWIVPSY